jgi:lipoprotein-anchoring transpeptidase ErfK/SrfK
MQRKYLISVFIGIAFLPSLAGGRVSASASPAGDPGEICTVAAMMETPDLCPLAGPAPARADYWRQGLLPRQPLPAVPLDPALKQLDRSYAIVSKDRKLSFYANIDDAIADRPQRYLGPGFVWISFIDVIVRDNKKYLMTGDWKDYVRREDVTPKDYIAGQFGGFELAESPTRPFGWVVEPQGAYPSRTPGGKPDLAAPKAKWYDVVEVFDSQDVNGLMWFEIGVNQWVDQKKVGLVFPLTQIPDGVPAGAKWISVNLFEQTLAAYEGDRLVFATLTATGLPGWWTRPGLFQTKSKYQLDSMQGAFEEDKSDFYYVADVPWVMYFDRARAIHGEYWHNALGYKRSHGCVNVPVADAHWIFNWAPKGTYVWVFDPSGKTPTDAASYANDAGI